MLQNFLFIRVKILVPALALLLGITAAGNAYAAAATLHVEQKSGNATYGQWVLTLPDGGDYVSTVKAKILNDLEAGSYRFSVRNPEKSHPTITLTKNSVVMQKSNSNAIVFDLREGDVVRLTSAYSYTGTVQIRSNPSGVGFVMEGPNGLKFTGTTPAEFTDMAPVWYRVTYALIPDCEAQKRQERALLEGSTLTFFANIACGDKRIPLAGRTAEILGNKGQPPAKSEPLVHTTMPSQRLLQTANLAEVVPGGRIRFTVEVRNVTRHTLNNVVVTDMFSPEAMEILLPLLDGGTLKGNTIVWNIPKIYAGQTWKTTFEARVSETLVTGDRVVLLAHARSDENDANIYPETWSSVVGISIAYLPQTGGRYDMLFGLAALLGAACVTRLTVWRKQSTSGK